MSLKYRDKNGAEHILAGLTPGGNIEYGAVATRINTVSIPVTAAGESQIISVEFADAMPDDDYLINYECSTSAFNYRVQNKSETGFTLTCANVSSSATTYAATLKITSYKLYDVADAEVLYSTVQDMEKALPSDASSSNKLATIRDVTSETRSLDRRLDDVEDVIPNDATILNKLATAEDVAEAMANAGLKVTDTIPASPDDGDVLLYIGTEEGFTKGGIYQYSATQREWILISTADVDLSNYETSWTGSKAEWDALSATEKAKYKLVSLNDDCYGTIVADAVTLGDMRPITSNAIARLFLQEGVSVRAVHEVNAPKSTLYLTYINALGESVTVTKEATGTGGYYATGSWAFSTGVVAWDIKITDTSGGTLIASATNALTGDIKSGSITLGISNPSFAFDKTVTLA
jgi:hypothetical protein